MKIWVLHVIDHLGYGGAPVVVNNIAEKINIEHIEILSCVLRTNPCSIPIKARLINLAYQRYDPYTIGNTVQQALCWEVLGRIRRLRLAAIPVGTK